jgi:hypothetical protein
MIRKDTRAVSVAVTHALMIGITALLITGLLIGTGTLLENQQDRTAQQQVDQVGADLLSHVDRLDQLNDTGETVGTSLRLDYPATIGGGPYTLALVDGSGPLRTEWTLQIEVEAVDRTVHYPIANHTSLTESRARGDEPTLSLCTNGSILLGEC